jgi:hypothetical protein
MIPQQSACTVSAVLVSSAVAGIGLPATGRVLLGRISLFRWSKKFLPLWEIRGFSIVFRKGARYFW